MSDRGGIPAVLALPSGMLAGMEQGDIEGEARRLLSVAGESSGEPADVCAVVVALLGAGAISVAPRHAFRLDGALVRVGDAWRIYVRRGLDPVRARFVVAHELAHWALRDSGLAAEEVEPSCDALAAAILAPCAYVRRAATGIDCLASIADEAAISDTCAALRIGEALGVPLAVVGPMSVRARGPSSWAWPHESELRRLARRGGPGVRRVELREHRRVALAVGE